MLRKLEESLWVAEQPLSYMGLAVGARMTVIRLAEGGLWVHSPLRLTPPLREAVEALGPVHFLVAPNKLHHLFIGEWMTAHPRARAYAAPGLPEKRKDLRFHEVLSEELPSPWAGQIDMLPWQGAPAMNEWVFFHRSSRTLVLSDLVFNIGPESGFLTRLVFQVFGGYGRPGTSLFDRRLHRDRAAARRSLDALLQWDFERVILAHGHIVERDGARALREVYAWL